MCNVKNTKRLYDAYSIDSFGIKQQVGKGVNNTEVHKILNCILATYHANMEPVNPLMDLKTVNFNRVVNQNSPTTFNVSLMNLISKKSVLWCRCCY